MADVILKAGDVVTVEEDQPRLVVHRSAIGKFANQLTAEAHAYASDAVKEFDTARQALEDIRADRRNRNRFLTLLVALIGATFIPSIMVAVLGASSLKYSFAITIIPDAFITLWAYLKKY